MKRMLVVLATTIAGCSSFAPIDMASQPTLDLCMNYLTKPQSVYRGQVIAELNNRRENCQAYVNLAAARINADASAGSDQTALGLYLLNQGAQQPSAPSPSIRCTTYQRGPWGSATCQ